MPNFTTKPSRKALGYASMAGKDNPLKFNEVILNDIPKELSDTEWAARLKELEWIRKQEAKANGD
ncbi:MAG: hypothetical protein LBS50_05635 [Prevotellaceae bacterium]|nr:hypothetical protein [Prevotellaceae bacterium]